MTFYIFLILIYLVGFLLIIGFILRKKIAKYSELKEILNAANTLNEDLKASNDKRRTIDNFLSIRNDSDLVKKIILKWIELQQSLSNFQKYDFDLHVQSYLRFYKIEYAVYSRNLLLVGLLLTFFFLAYSFSGMSDVNGTTELVQYVTEKFFNNIGSAISSTIAAILASLIITAIGKAFTDAINRLHVAISDLLIIHVHGVYDRAGTDDIHEVLMTTMQAMLTNVRDSAASIAAINKQSAESLKILTDGVSTLAKNANEFNNALDDFKQLQLTHQESQNKLVNTIDKLNIGVETIKEVFELENNALHKINDNLIASVKESENSNEISKNINTALLHIKESILDINRTIQEQSKNIDQLSIKISEDLIGKIQNQIETTSASVLKLNSLFNELPNNILNTNREIYNQISQLYPELRVNLVELAQSIKTLPKQIEETGSSVTKQFSDSVIKFEESIRAIEDNFIKNTQKLVNRTIDNGDSLTNELLKNVKSHEKIAYELENLSKKIAAIKFNGRSTKPGLIEFLFGKSDRNG